MIHTLSAPAFISLELTAICNGRCFGCSNVFYKNREQTPALHLTDWQNILQKLSPFAYHLRLTGGEPTLHPEFVEIVSYIDTLGHPFTVFSNGLWQAPDKIIDTLSATSSFAGLLISLHGANAEAHETFNPVPGSFEVIKENIARATAASLNVVTSTVITQHNYDQIADIAALSQQLGAHHAVFNRYLGREMPDLEPNPTQLRQSVQQVDQLRHEGYPVKFGDCIPQCFTSSSSVGCLAGVAYCSIDPWGNMRPCTQADIKCGNLLDISLEEAWNSSAMQHWRSLVPDVCEQQCAAFSQCHGGCRATAMIRGLDQDPLMTTPLDLAQMPPPTQIDLYEDLCPVGHYMLRREPFGYVVLGDGLALVIPEAKPLLDVCDGTVTLREIEQSYGQAGLALIAELWRKGLVSWHSDEMENF